MEARAGSIPSPIVRDFQPKLWEIRMSQPTHKLLLNLHTNLYTLLLNNMLQVPPDAHNEYFSWWLWALSQKTWGHWNCDSASVLVTLLGHCWNLVFSTILYRHFLGVPVNNCWLQLYINCVAIFHINLNGDRDDGFRTSHAKAVAWFVHLICVLANVFSFHSCLSVEQLRHSGMSP